MIELTKPNKEIIFLNPFVIESMEKKNYILLTLTNGKKYMVLESIEVISNKIFQWWECVFKINKRIKFVDSFNKSEL